LVDDAVLAAVKVGRSHSVADRLRRARREAERPGWVPRSALVGHAKAYRGNNPRALALLSAARQIDATARLAWWESPEWAGPVVIGTWRNTEMVLVNNEAEDSEGRQT
jgi:hypothetical protein